MSIVKTIGNYFRSGASTPSKKIDKYGIVAPVIAELQSLESTVAAINTLQSNSSLKAILVNRANSDDKHHGVAATAYKQYLGSLSASLRTKEQKTPLSTLLDAIAVIKTNLEQIEDNFDTLFGSVVETGEATSLRTSSLVIIGYIEQVSIFSTWFTRLYAFVTSDEHTIIPPFWEKGLINDTRQIATFVNSNIERWSHTGGILTIVKTMQSKNSDVVIKTGDTYIDEFVHDRQFSDSETELMTSSFANPVLWVHQEIYRLRESKIAKLDSRRQWLIHKIMLEESRQRGMDPNSPEYRKIQKAIAYYENLITKYEQQLERRRS